ncbi:MAG: lipopolysaccharide biosynthesis protein [Candidatus Neomarinimicrobiota bacterium]
MYKRYRALLTDSLKYSLTKVLPGIVGLISVILIIKIIGTEEYGKYSIVYSFTLTLTAFCGGWLNQALLRYYPGNNHIKKIENQAIFSLFISAVSGILILLGIYIIIGDSFFQDTNILLVIFFFIAVLLYQFQISIYRSQIRPNMVVFITSIQSILSLIIPLFFIYYFNSDVKYIIIGLTIAYLGSSIKNIFFKISSLRYIFTYQQKSNSILYELFKFGWPLSIWLTISLALQFFDRFFINYHFDENLTGIFAGFYDLVVRIFSILIFPITMALHPRMMYLWNESNHFDAISIWKIAILIQILIFTFIYTIVQLFFEEISNSLLWLFSDLNPQYFHLLIPLLIGGFIWQFALLIHKPIELNKSTHLMLISIAFALIVNLGGNIIFLPKYGLIATAYTFILSGTVYIISSIILSISFYKKIFIQSKPTIK